MITKKAWCALSLWFFIWTVGFTYPIFFYENLMPKGVTGDAPFIVLNIRYYTFLLLASISTMATGVCIMCYLISKEQ